MIRDREFRNKFSRDGESGIPVWSFQLKQALENGKETHDELFFDS